jgi:hypothetical protein
MRNIDIGIEIPMSNAKFRLIETFKLWLNLAIIHLLSILSKVDNLVWYFNRHRYRILYQSIRHPRIDLKKLSCPRPNLLGPLYKEHEELLNL